MKIPKVIHQVWLGGEIPEDLQKATDQLRKLHPDYKYILWTEDNIGDIKDLEIYKYFDIVQFKSDVVRYEVLNQFGGFYCDHDILWLKNMESLVKDDFIIVKECPKIRPNAIGNCFIGTTPGHPFIQDIVKTSRKRFNQLVTKTASEMQKGLYITGPWMVTDLCRKKYPQAFSLSVKNIMSSRYLKPKMTSVKDLPKNAYALHFSNLAGEMYPAMQRRVDLAKKMLHEVCK